MASPSPNKHRSNRSNLDTDDEDENEIRRNSDSEDDDPNISYLSATSYGKNNSAIRPKSPGFSDASYSSPTFRNRSNYSQSSESPSTPPKLYPSLDNDIPKYGRKAPLYPDLSYNSKISSDTDSPNKTKNVSSTIIKEAESTCTNMTCFLIIACIFFGLVASIYISNNDNSGGFLDTLMPFERFVKNIKDLENDFPTQGRRTWKTVKSTAKHVLNETDPIYPSIILIGAELTNSKLAECLAKKISDTFKSSTGDRSATPTTDIESYSHLSSAEQKMRLDQAFQQAFHKGSSKSILVENLQSLSGEAALLLYKYCDNDNAPYRNVLILLTINVSSEDVDLSRPVNVERYLAGRWNQGINADKVNALMSRVANNIVVVNKESPEVFRQKC